MLKSWQANTDFQPFKVVIMAYMAAYFSKSKQETSEDLRQREKEMKTQKIKSRESIYKITHAFANLCLVLVEEAAY